MRKPQVSRYVFLCRPGFERFLEAELGRERLRPAGLVAGAVECDPTDYQPVFGRAGFRVMAQPPQRGVLEAWALDTVEGQRGHRAATDAVAALRVEPSKERVVCCAFSSEVLVWGDRPTAAPRRMRRGAETLSRAALKIDEAFEWIADAPGAREVCVDLGAAPGGWSQRLLARGAKVIAVDPAALKIQHARLRHERQNAFRYAPPEPVDWLFCDMAYRPLEVAQLLAKWGRQRWAIRLVANIKLPMKDKWAILDRVAHTLEQGGWKNVKMRQLYHDRDEVTVSASRF